MGAKMALWKVPIAVIGGFTLGSYFSYSILSKVVSETKETSVSHPNGSTSTYYSRELSFKSDRGKPTPLGHSSYSKAKQHEETVKERLTRLGINPAGTTVASAEPAHVPEEKGSGAS